MLYHTCKEVLGGDLQPFKMKQMINNNSNNINNNIINNNIKQ